MKHLVYKTYNPSTGQYYFGKHSTRNIYDGYQGSGNWIKESDKDTLVTDTIAVVETELEAYELEELIVSLHYNDALCMNITKGGSGIKIGSHTEQSKAKIKDKLTGKKHSEQRKLNIGKGRTGKKHSKESKAKISKSLLGNKNSVGRVLSEDHIKKISSFQTGKTVSLETRKKISNSRTGKVEVKGKRVYIEGTIYKSQSEAARLLNIPRNTLIWRINSTSEIYKEYKRID
jgi:group I intron endonuclease